MVSLPNCGYKTKVNQSVLRSASADGKIIFLVERCSFIHNESSGETLRNRRALLQELRTSNS